MPPEIPAQVETNFVNNNYFSINFTNDSFCQYGTSNTQNFTNTGIMVVNSVCRSFDTVPWWTRTSWPPTLNSEQSLPGPRQHQHFFNLFLLPGLPVDRGQRVVALQHEHCRGGWVIQSFRQECGLEPGQYRRGRF